MSQRAGYLAMCLLGRNIELNDMSGTCEARTLVWGDALPEELEDVNFSSSVLLRLFLSSISVRLAAETASSAYYGIGGGF